MARTKASACGDRRTVVAKASRKITSTPKPSTISKGGGSKSTPRVGACVKRPTPSWQKGIDTFIKSSPSLSSNTKSKEGTEKNNAEGCSSSCNVSQTLSKSMDSLEEPNNVRNSSEEAQAESSHCNNDPIEDLELKKLNQVNDELGDKDDSSESLDADR